MSDEIKFEWRESTTADGTEAVEGALFHNGVQKTAWSEMPLIHPGDFEWFKSNFPEILRGEMLRGEID